MLIIAVGWIYVVSLMSLTEPNFVAGCLTFLLYGGLPVSVLLYLSGVRITRRRRTARASRETEASHEAPGEVPNEVRNAVVAAAPSAPPNAVSAAAAASDAACPRAAPDAGDR